MLSPRGNNRQIVMPAPLNPPKGGIFDAYFVYFMTIIFKI
jgi:hypothetical protein